MSTKVPDFLNHVPEPLAPSKAHLEDNHNHTVPLTEQMAPASPHHALGELSTNVHVHVSLVNDEMYFFEDAFKFEVYVKPLGAMNMDVNPYPEFEWAA